MKHCPTNPTRQSGRRTATAMVPAVGNAVGVNQVII